MQNAFSEKICNRRFRRKKSAFIFKRSAVGAFGFGGVHFVAADFDMVKAAAVAILAVVCAVVDVASDVSVYFHNKKNLLIVLILFFTKQKVLFRKNVLIIKTVT